PRPPRWPGGADRRRRPGGGTPVPTSSPRVAGCSTMATSLTGDTNPSASSNLSCSSSQSTTTFSTSFEAGDPQPLATTTPSPSPAGGVELTVTVGGGPAFSPTAKTGVGFTGKRALRYEGRHPVDGTATASVRLFEVDLPVQPETTLSYLIFPELSDDPRRSEEHTSELQSRENLVCRLLLEKKKVRPTCYVLSSC